MQQIQRLPLLVLIFLFALLSCKSRGEIPALRMSELNGDSNFSVSPAEAMSKERILSEVDSGFQNLESTWFSKGPDSSPMMESFVQGLLKLARNDRRSYEPIRASVIEAALNLKDDRLDLGLQIRLAAYDPEAWQSYFEKFSSVGTPDPALKDSLVPVLLNMPDELRDEIYAKIPLQYGKAMRHKYDLSVAQTGERKGLSPKRAIDAFIRYTIHAETFFQGATNYDEVKNAYRQYIDFKKRILFKGTEFCEYTADDITSLMMHFQKQIGNNWNTFGRFKGFGHAGREQEAYLLFMGSFVNCHAQLSKDQDHNDKTDPSFDPNYSKSDLDFYVSPAEMIPTLHKFESRLYAALVSPEAQKFKNTADLKARLQMHPYRPVEELDASTLSPVFLRLKKNDLLLHVYPPVRFSALPVDRTLLALPEDLKSRLPTPACYALAGSCESTQK